MDLSTPLPEVARFLSPETAELVLWETPYVQERILEIVRAHIVALERDGVTLDPVRMQDETTRVVRVELREIAKGRVSP